MKNILLFLIVSLSLSSIGQNVLPCFFEKTDMTGYSKDSSNGTVSYYRKYSDMGFEKKEFLGTDNYNSSNMLVSFSRVDNSTGIIYSCEYYENRNPKRFTYTILNCFTLDIFFDENGNTILVENFNGQNQKHGWSIEYDSKGGIIKKEYFEKGEIRHSSRPTDE